MENKEKILLYNTLGRKIEEFIPINNQLTGLYTCGPTVYGRAHIGNMRAYIFADTVRRTLEYGGYNVKHVMNITDVGHLTSDADEGEDKLAKAAKEAKQSAWAISQIWTEQFFKDTSELNIKPVHITCKATDHIKEQIELIQKLETKGYTYLTSDGVYYDTSKFPRYPDLSRLDVEGLQSGIRIDMGEKKNKTDFALWKFSKSEEKRDMEWESPWGKGFPGWHIECSAMSMKYLGETFDIHTGGIDHIPIHHTNEIAQSEAATGKKFVNYWLHSEFLVMSDAEKMSKSLGNVVNLDTLKSNGINPLAYRYLCLNAHYRKPLFYGKEILSSANNGFNNLINMVLKIKDSNPTPAGLDTLSVGAKNYLKEFKLAIFNDLNAPQALAVMWNVLKDNAINSDEKYSLLLDFDKIFGFDIAHAQRENNTDNIPNEVLELLQLRNTYRAEKNWADADAVRNKIIGLGYQVIDSAGTSHVQKR